MSRILPILFNTEMVCAILDGRKTVTRRLVKDMDIINQWDLDIDGTPSAFVEQSTGDVYPPTYPCPYQPGDILYVRETWCRGSLGYQEEQYYYKADNNKFYCRWYPSIHMPKEAARIWLKITDVRVERLQNMTLNAFLNEGVVIRPKAYNDPDNAYLQAREIFHDIWDSTIKKPDLSRYGWDANPWVWVIEFERCEKPEVNT